MSGRFPIRWLVITALTALLMFAYTYLDEVARNSEGPALVVFIEEMTGVFGAGLLFPAARFMARRYGPDAWPRVLIHGPAVALFSVTHTTWNWATRELLFRLAGLGDYDYGRIPVRYLMELPIDIVIYTLFVAGVWMFDGWARERTRALRAAQLEAQLHQAQLQNLRLQLQPHFLFNALNTISSAMYEDPQAADVMLSHLSDLLRLSLRTGQAQEVTFDEELQALDHYTALLRARFGERLRLDVVVDERVRLATVPSLILQPLVENAVRHGNLSLTGRGRIEVRGWPENGRLLIEVDDDGPGFGGRAAQQGDGQGVGLAATRSRLQLLYGGRHAFDLRRGTLGGLCVRLDLPLAAGRHAAGA